MTLHGGQGNQFLADLLGVSVTDPADPNNPHPNLPIQDNASTARPQLGIQPPPVADLGSAGPMDLLGTQGTDSSVTQEALPDLPRNPANINAPVPGVKPSDPLAGHADSYPLELGNTDAPLPSNVHPMPSNDPLAGHADSYPLDIAPEAGIMDRNLQVPSLPGSEIGGLSSSVLQLITEMLMEQTNPSAANQPVQNPDILQSILNR